VYCRSGQLGALEGEYLKTGARVKAFRLLFFNPMAYWRFYRELRRERFSAICDFHGNFAGFPLLCAKLAGIPVRMAQYRGSEDHFPKTYGRLLYNRFVQHVTIHCATKMVSNSAAALDYFFPGKWRADKRFRVIYNGTDLPDLVIGQEDVAIKEEFNIPCTAFVVGHIGRYNPAKNHETIMEVAVRLCRKYSDIYFVLVGLNVDHAYQEYVNAEGLGDRILMPGYRTDVHRLLSMFDLFFFPSVTEGQPNALIEAMIAGLPVLTSNIASIKEAVPVELHAKLLPPKDIEQAVLSIERLFNDKAARMDYSCREWALDRFDSAKRFSEFREILLTSPIRQELAETTSHN
jgi:glycosyltransferase involved in cell wall biosynthesis